MTQPMKYVPYAIICSVQIYITYTLCVQHFLERCIELYLSKKHFHYTQFMLSSKKIFILLEDIIAYYTIQVGNLLPWNAFVTAQPYYQARFCNTQFSNSFENFFAAFFTASQPVGLYLVRCLNYFIIVCFLLCMYVCMYE